MRVSSYLEMLLGSIIRVLCCLTFVSGECLRLLNSLQLWVGLVERELMCPVGGAKCGGSTQ